MSNFYYGEVITSYFSKFDRRDHFDTREQARAWDQHQAGVIVLNAAKTGVFEAFGRADARLPAALRFLADEIEEALPAEAAPQPETT